MNNAYLDRLNSWKLEYKNLSEEIRTTKKISKDFGQEIIGFNAQSKLAYSLKPKARKMMEVRKELKEEARDYTRSRNEENRRDTISRIV